MNRRGFLKLTAGGIAAAIAAPYVITTPGLLMKVRATALWRPCVPLTTPTPWPQCLNMTASEVLARQSVGDLILADLPRAYVDKIVDLIIGSNEILADMVWVEETIATRI